MCSFCLAFCLVLLCYVVELFGLLLGSYVVVLYCVCFAVLSCCCVVVVVVVVLLCCCVAMLLSCLGKYWVITLVCC